MAVRVLRDFRVDPSERFWGGPAGPFGASFTSQILNFAKIQK